MEFDVLDCSVTPRVLNKSLAFDKNKINAKIPFENQANEQTTIKGSEARRVGLPALSWDAASGSQTPSASGFQSSGSRSHFKFARWKKKPSLSLVNAVRRTPEDSQPVSRLRTEGEGQENLGEAGPRR